MRRTLLCTLCVLMCMALSACTAAPAASPDPASIGSSSQSLTGTCTPDPDETDTLPDVSRDIPAYTVAGGNPARVIRARFDEELTALLLAFRWWDLEPQALVEVLPLLCSPDLERVKAELSARLGRR